jgi:type VI secretion system protein ImpC
MVDVAGTGPSAAASTQRALDALIGDLIGAKASGEVLSAQEQRRLLEAVDAALAQGLRSALRDPALAALEEAWLGLRFLVRRADLRSGLRIHVAACRRGEVVERMAALVAPFVEQARSEGRVACVICAFELGSDAGDLGAAQALARAAEKAAVPVLASLHHAPLGAATLEDALPALEAEPAWAELRRSSAGRWLVLAANRFLLRPAYGEEGEAPRDFPFEENPEGAEPIWRWGNPAWLLGAVVAESFARTGWGTNLTGAHEGGMVGELPVRPWRRATGEAVRIPLEVLLSEPKLLALSEAGLAPLGCRRNSDAAFLASVPSVFRPASASAQEASNESARATLAFQLAAAQVRALLEPLLLHVDRTRPAAEIGQTLARGLEFLTAEGEHALLAVNVEEAAGHLTLNVIPRGGPLRGLPSFALELATPP